MLTGAQERPLRSPTSPSPPSGSHFARVAGWQRQPHHQPACLPKAYPCPPPPPLGPPHPRGHLPGLPSHLSQGGVQQRHTAAVAAGLWSRTLLTGRLLSQQAARQERGWEGGCHRSLNDAAPCRGACDASHATPTRWRALPLPAAQPPATASPGGQSRRRPAPGSGMDCQPGWARSLGGRGAAAAAKAAAATELGAVLPGGTWSTGETHQGQEVLRGAH